jgi:hypothetical protein
VAAGRAQRSARMMAINVATPAMLMAATIATFLESEKKLLPAAMSLLFSFMHAVGFGPNISRVSFQGVRFQVLIRTRTGRDSSRS